MTASEAREQRTYGNWRAGQRAGLFGLGPVATGAAFAVMIIGALMLTFSRAAAVYTLICGAVALAPLAIKIQGRTGFQVVSTRIAWFFARSARRHVYLSGIASPVSDTHRLPGVLAKSL